MRRIATATCEQRNASSLSSIGLGIATVPVIHAVERVERSGWEYRLKCSCGKTFFGPDVIRCQRAHELHLMAEHNREISGV